MWYKDENFTANNLKPKLAHVVLPSYLFPTVFFFSLGHTECILKFVAKGTKDKLQQI